MFGGFGGAKARAPGPKIGVGPGPGPVLAENWLIHLLVAHPIY